jgi:hypothetical protein
VCGDVEGVQDVVDIFSVAWLASVPLLIFLCFTCGHQLFRPTSPIPRVALLLILVANVLLIFLQMLLRVFHTATSEVGGATLSGWGSVLLFHLDSRSLFC